MHPIGILIVASQWALGVGADTQRLDTTFDKPRNGDKLDVGPDGPWQAVWVGINDESTHDVPMWPTNALQTVMVSGEKGGWYNKSDNAFEPEDQGIVFPVDGFVPDVWPIGLDRYDVSLWGVTVFDYLRFDPIVINRYSPVYCNHSIRVLDEFPRGFVNVSSATRYAGILGLGNEGTEWRKQLGRSDWPGPIVSEKELGDHQWNPLPISSNSWFMHLGSVSPKQYASFTFGGYDKGRVVGDVGEFKMSNEYPIVFLNDVRLGHESGDSPFDTDVGSVWQGITSSEDAEGQNQNYGGSAGAALVLPNAAVPYIYLPPGTCEAAAEHLPVQWSEANGLYMWDLDQEERVNRIINSPAYMTFVFEGEQPVTVKIPFKLLNLTLDELPEREFKWPQRSYWPCKPWDLEDDMDLSLSGVGGVWQLGRAFLQGAFTGYDYDARKFYMAQAPGPQTPARQLVDHTGEAIERLPAKMFAETWATYWTEFKAADNSTQTEPAGAGGGSGLGTGAKAGIGAGVACGVVGAGLAAWFFLRRRSRRNQSEESEKTEAVEAEHFMGRRSELYGTEVGTDGGGVVSPGLSGSFMFESQTANHEISELPQERPKSAGLGGNATSEGMVYEMPDNTPVAAVEEGGKTPK